MNIFKTFTDSAKEFKKLNSIVTCALFIALHTVLACFISIQVTPTLRISISFIANVIIGAFFGPVMGLVAGGLGDIIQFLIKPTGPYFYGWTVNAALAGFIYGCFLYKRFPKKVAGLKGDKASKDGDASNTVNKTEKVAFKANSMTVRMINAVLGVAILVTLFVCDFASVRDANGEVILSGNAFGIVKDSMNSEISLTSPFFVAIMLGVLAVFVIISQLFKLKVLPMIAAVLVGSAAVLAIYTDKKTVTGEIGLWIITGIIIVYVCVTICAMIRNNALDYKFLFILIICMTLDTILVNILLGTYWCTVMYGKGFAVYFTSRLIKNLVQLPINVALAYSVLNYLRVLYKPANNKEKR